jgi:GDPmannose 4,6-dehydratase
MSIDGIESIAGGATARGFPAHAPGRKTALVTGPTGQDGAYLIRLLLEKGYEVLALVRRVAAQDEEMRFSRIAPLLPRIRLVAADLQSYAGVLQIAGRQEIHECYHLAAQSYVARSFEDPFSTFDTNINGTLHILEAFRQLNPRCRIYNAASSEMFGKVTETPQRETTRFYPRSPYGVSKAAAFYLTVNYRESYGMHCSNGILFNHESPLRGKEFVTRKIAAAAARISLGLQRELRLGNLDARRDWGHAADYVRAMWLMLQQPEPSDYVVATGETHSVREFCELAFAEVGLKWSDYTREDPTLLRPAEVDQLAGDSARARRVLGWAPLYSIADLVREMVAAEVRLLRGRRGVAVAGQGAACA